MADLAINSDESDLLNDAMKYVRKLKKGEIIPNPENKKVKIAILGSYSIQFFVIVLKYLLSLEGIQADIYEGQYNGINIDIYDVDSQFYKFAPEIVIILPYHNDVIVNPTYFEKEDVISDKVEEFIGVYSELWRRVSEKINCHILQANFVIPPLTKMGCLEANYIFSDSHFLKRINLEFEKRHPEYITIIDLDRLASNIGKYQWFNYSEFFWNKAGFDIRYIGEVVREFVTPILSLIGKGRKCLVLDLDNTLWGGVVSEEGCQGIIIDHNSAEGEAYRAFQQYILNLKSRGVILAVCSKNDEKIAKEPFKKNENMLIHLNDISCFVANWDDKVTNICLIAEKLNIGTDSMVFVDDNPVERQLIKDFLPSVLVVDLPVDVADYCLALEKEKAFDWIQITPEDLLRSSSYQENVQRDKLKLNFDSYEDYLINLRMTGCVSVLTDECVGRFVQLINKSNQFNLRTKRYCEADIRDMMDRDDCCLLYIKLMDRFSDYGLISCIILKKQEDECFLDTWLMSCRVLKRDVEKMAYNAIVEQAVRWGCKKITGEYIPSKKNGLVKDLFPSLGFTKIVNDNNCQDSEKYYMNVDSKNKLAHSIMFN